VLILEKPKLKNPHLLLILLFVLISVSALSQGRAHTCCAITQNRYVRTWNVVSPIARVDSIPVDTAFINFQDVNPMDRFSIANSWNGNLGSPIQSKIFFARPQNSRFIFADAYYPYLVRPDNVSFFRTKTPFANLQYLGGLFTNFRDEDNVRFLFTANANRKLNFGAALDYTRAVGVYANQSGRRTSAHFFGSYDGERYQSSGAIIFNRIDNWESGGLSNPNQIFDPNLMRDPSTLNTRLGQNPGYSGFTYNAFVYNQSYAFGFNRTIEVSEDSVRTEFVPVTRLGHRVVVSEERKRYLEPRGVNTDFFQNTFFSPLVTNDTAAVQSVSNTFSLSIEEEFNRRMPFGVTAYLTHDIERYMMMADSARLMHENRMRTRVGGVLSRQHGTRFKSNITAELDLLGAQIGDFSLAGDMGGFFRLWNDSVALIARGFVKNETPSFFLQRYSSNHFRWNNDFSQVYRTQVGGTFTIPTRRFALDVAVQNITNLIYFNHLAMPAQHSGNVQVVAANLRQDFHFGRFRFENNLIYQLSSNQNILPLPTLALHSNLYFLDRWFDVLDVQLGVDVRFHTAYYSHKYMPATGVFHVQNWNEERIRIGNYPVMNLYGNFHLRQARFFVKYYHFNHLFMEGAFFSMPYFPINPAVFRMGISWNFYN